PVSPPQPPIAPHTIAEVAHPCPFAFIFSAGGHPTKESIIIHPALISLTNSIESLLTPTAQPPPVTCTHFGV
ncbi:MAG: hypothetical protein ACI9OO_001314, partial [Bacteroidia bacterium]